MPGAPFSGSLASFLTCSIVVVAVALRPQHPQICASGNKGGAALCFAEFCYSPKIAVALPSVLGSEREF